MTEPLSVLYCLDTEGPVDETPAQTVTRLYDHGLPRSLPADRTTLSRVRGGYYGERLADIADPRRTNFLDSWSAVTDMLEHATSDESRWKYTDSFGTPLKISWFVIDLVGYAENPRRRAQGQHAVWDQVSRLFGPADSIGWHVHTLPATREALIYGTSWTSFPDHEASLCRRLLDKHAFPASFRAGGAIERNDLSHWLERFIPFDYSALPGVHGHGMDWRGTPNHSYHPSFKDYRTPGDMQRWITPCYDADSWVHRASLDDVTSDVFAFANHDRLPILRDVERIVAMLNASGREWRWATASPPGSATLSVTWQTTTTVLIESEPIFGEPFVAIEEGERVYRDNAIRESETTWSYTFHRKPSRFAVAVNTPEGRTGVVVCST